MSNFRQHTLVCHFQLYGELTVSKIFQTKILPTKSDPILWKNNQGTDLYGFNWSDLTAGQRRRPCNGLFMSISATLEMLHGGFSPRRSFGPFLFFAAILVNACQIANSTE